MLELTPADEAALVERCRGGDMMAYKALYDRYEQPLLRTACRILGGREDAEDAVQNAFLNLYKGIDGYRRRDGARFSTYLFRILQNSCFDILRKKRRTETVDVDLDRVAAATAAPDGDRLAIEAAIAGLPARMRACFVLFAVEEMTLEEVAGSLELRVGTVKAAVHRARVKLRAALSGAAAEVRS